MDVAMQLSHQGFKPKRQKSKDSGRVAGPGTGTSDDVETSVPEGSYIMPADSTAQMGDQALAGLGYDSRVPVNLSNGEFKLPPEQVHAVGVQALDQMRAATHTPGEQPSPEFFFRDGGVVEDDPNRVPRSRAVVTYRAQPPATTTQPVPTMAQPSALPPPQPRAATDFYANSRGEAARGFMPSSSREVVPAGPAQRAQGALPSPQPTPTAQPGAAEPNYRARAETMARAKADSEAFRAQQAAQDARFQAAANPPAAEAAGGGRMAAMRNAAGAGFSRARSLVNGPAGKLVGGLAVVDALRESGADALIGGPGQPDATARYAQRFGMSEPTGDGSFGDMAKFAALRGLGFASDLGNSMTGGLAKYLYRDTYSMPRTDQQGGDAGSTDTQPGDAGGNGAGNTGNQGAGGAGGGDLPSNNVTRVGNSYSGSNIGPGFTINGRQPGGGSIDPSEPAGGGAPGVGGSFQQQLANVRAMNAADPAAAPGRAAPRKNDVSWMNDFDDPRRIALRNAMIGGSSGGSRGEQIIDARMRKAVIDSILGADKDTRNNDAAMERTQLTDQGATARQAMSDMARMATSAEGNQIARERLNMDKEAAGFTTRAQRRMENLYDKYAATEDANERSALAEQIRALSGKDTPNRFTVVPGGQQIDPTTNMAVTQPSMVINNQTGQIVDLGKSQVPQGKRSVGTKSVVNGKAAIWDGSKWVPQQ